MVSNLLTFVQILIVVLSRSISVSEMEESAKGILLRPLLPHSMFIAKVFQANCKHLKCVFLLRSQAYCINKAQFEHYSSSKTPDGRPEYSRSEHQDRARLHVLCNNNFNVYRVSLAAGGLMITLVARNVHVLAILGWKKRSASSMLTNLS